MTGSEEEKPITTEEEEEEEGCGIKLFSIKIPEGKKEGDHFTYTDEEDGVELEIVVPKDKKGGDTMEILIDDGDDDIEAVMVDLGPQIGVTLNLVTFLDEPGDFCELIDMEELAKGPKAEEGDVAAVAATEKDADADDDDDSDYIDDQEIDGTNYMVWPAGIELAQFLASPYAKVLLEKKRNALELGSGVGVGGMALAAALARNSDAPKDTQVTMTDVPVAMSLLTANWKENEEAVKNDSGITVNTTKLVWGDDNDMEAGKYDLIVGADLLYNIEDDDTVIGKLSSTFDKLLNPETGLILLATRWRKFNEERAFFQQMEKLGYEFVHAKKRIADMGGDVSPSDVEESYSFKNAADLSWQEFGSETSEASKKYFSETKFKTLKEGMEEVVKSLSEIDEMDLEVMAEDDFDACELAHIHIYAGYKK